MTFFDLVLQTGGSLHPDGEPDEYISTFAGVIGCEGNDGTRRRVGKLLAYRINAGVAAANGEPLFDVCDSHSADLHEVHTLLYEPGQYHYREAVTERFDEAGSDTLVLDYVVLNPRWRGLRLGLLAVRKTIDLLGGGCGLVVSYVAPLRHDSQEPLGVPASWLPRHKTPQARREARQRLRRYFRQMGFVRLGRTPYYVLSRAGPAPTLADLLKPPREAPP
jgi:hypothetical protein